MPTQELPRRSSRSHLPIAKSMDWSSPRHEQHLSPHGIERVHVRPRPVPVQPQPPRSSTTETQQPRTLNMQLCVRAKVTTNFGDTAVLVGSSARLGCWAPTKGLRLHTDSSSYPVWNGHVEIRHDANEKLEMKLLILRAGAPGEEPAVEWEPLEGNRTLGLIDGTTILSMQWGESHVTSEQRPRVFNPLTSSTPNVPATPATWSAVATPVQTPPRQTPPSHLQETLAQLRGTQPPAFVQAPRPNASFSVQPRPPIAMLPHATTPPSAAATPPPFLHHATASPIPVPIRSACVGGPLEAIQSMDQSWPPSIDGSFVDSHFGSRDSLDPALFGHHCGSTVSMRSNASGKST
jgi:hypothetical protein